MLHIKYGKECKPKITFRKDSTSDEFDSNDKST